MNILITGLISGSLLALLAIPLPTLMDVLCCFPTSGTLLSLRGVRLRPVAR